MHSPNYEQRMYEILDFFNIIRDFEIRMGSSSVQARALAYDAVELRFGIGKDRARKIISEVKVEQTERKHRFRSSFILNNSRLIELIQIVNNEYTNKARN